MKVPNTSENRAKCICPNCPTYNECMEKGKERLFCAKEETKCNPEKQGCICGECPIASEFGLNKFYYCRTGGEK